MLGAGTLSSGGARAQDVDPLAGNDPNVITGLQLKFGIAANEILTDNAAGTANGGTITTNANGTATTTVGLEARRSRDADHADRFALRCDADPSGGADLYAEL